jgi:hypothetical protein
MARQNSYQDQLAQKRRYWKKHVVLSRATFAIKSHDKLPVEMVG